MSFIRRDVDWRLRTMRGARDRTEGGALGRIKESTTATIDTRKRKALFFVIN